MSRPRHDAKIPRMRCLLLLAATLALGGCAEQRSAAGDGFAGALARARARGTLLLVHFRLPGRPLSDAMDAAIAHDVATLGEFEQVRLDAEIEIARYRALVGGGVRAGAGLATCAVDLDGAPLAVHTGYLGPDALTAFAARTRALRDDLGDVLGAIAARPTDPELRLRLADTHLRLGRRGVAKDKLRAVHDEGCEPWSSRAAAALARIAVDDGDLEGARDWLARVAPRADLAPGIALTNGLLQLADCEPRRARATLEAASAAYPAHAEMPTLLLALGQALREAGADADALATFADIAARLPGSPAASRATELAAHVRSGDHGHSHD